MNDEKKDFLRFILSGVPGEIEDQKSSKRKINIDDLESVPQTKKIRKQSRLVNAVSEIEHKISSKRKIDDFESVPQRKKARQQSESVNAVSDPLPHSRIMRSSETSKYDDDQVLLTYRGVTVRMKTISALNDVDCSQATF